MPKFGYISGLRRGLRIHVFTEVGEPTGPDQRDYMDGGRLDYEVEYAITLCKKRSVGWKALVVSLEIEDPPQWYICKDCLRRLKKR